MSENKNKKNPRPIFTEDKSTFVDDFLSSSEKQKGAPEGQTLEESVIEALRQIYDPEIPVNIYDLGLIYNVEVDEDKKALITMTLTTPNCPVAETMPQEVELRASYVEGIQDAEVKLVFDPPWDPSKMSEEAKLELGFL
ncbi:MAG: SUF system Fe-S cluster assembly protein [Sphingomonadales bacterium]